MRQGHKSIRAREPICTRIFIICALAIYALMVFAAASQAAASEEPNQSAIEIVLDILKSDEQEMHAVAIAMVNEMPGVDITKALARELPNLPAISQVQLLSALSDRGDRAALPAVVEATKVKDESVRIAALKALGQLGDASNTMLLAQTAAVTTGAEQKAARESLYRLRGLEVNETILASIPQTEPGIKAELIRSIAERNIYAGVKTLLKSAQDSNSNVRLESFKVLRVVAGQEHLPGLIELLINVQGEAERREAEKTIATIARRIDDPSQRTEAVLAALPSVTEVKSRCSLLSVLGKVGDDNSLPVLIAALKDNDVNVQDIAISALSEWPDAAPINELLKIAQNSDNERHRILALRGFVRLIGLDGNRPAKEMISMYRQAMSLAPDASLKKRVLSGLANVKSFSALEMAAEYLEDKTLQQEAEFAVVKIAETTGCEEHSEQIKTIVQKIIQTTKSDSVGEKAKELLKKLEGQTEDEKSHEPNSPQTVTDEA